MKKVNLLSRAEMKKVMGGVAEAGGGVGLCVAICDGRDSATCQGTCSATDNVGCDGTDSSGQIYHKLCSDMQNIPD